MGLYDAGDWFRGRVVLRDVRYVYLALKAVKNIKKVEDQAGNALDVLDIFYNIFFRDMVTPVLANVACTSLRLPRRFKTETHGHRD